MSRLTWRCWLAPVLLALCTPLLLVHPAHAHGFTSVVYAELTEAGDGVVRAELELEYVLLVRSVSAAAGDPELESRAKSTFASDGADTALLDEHAGSVLGYVGDRFLVAVDGQPCRPSTSGTFSSSERDGVPHAVVELTFACPTGSTDVVHEVTSDLFPEQEGLVGGNDTIVEYALGDHTGNAVLTAADPTLRTDESSSARLAEFFVLGAEHLLFGLDHVLFLLALIVGSRRPRDILLAATAFTAAHSVTFILASLGLLSFPAAIVEPVIALSIAAVAGWHLWSAVRDGLDPPLSRPEAAVPPAPYDGPGRQALGQGGGVATLTAPTRTSTATAARGTRALTAADRGRLAVVFGFGLLHGMGFAGALGIDEPFSWGLLGSLLVFNLGIEVVQLGLIAAVFPLLMVLRRRQPAVGLWLGAVVAGAVTAIGCYWFVQRLLGTG